LLKESTIQSFNDCYGSLNSETQETITRIIEDNYFKSHAIGILTKVNKFHSRRCYRRSKNDNKKCTRFGI